MRERDPRGRRCGICIHEKRAQIELAIILGQPAKAIAYRFGVSFWGVYNHRDNHLSAPQLAALLTALKPSAIDLEELQRSESESLLSNLITQRARLQSVQEMAIDDGQLAVAIAAERAYTKNLELLAKLMGQLVQHHEVKHTSLLISPDYVKLRQIIVNTLAAFPDAARAVSAALHQLEAEAARRITEMAEKGKPMLIDARPDEVMA